EELSRRFPSDYIKYFLLREIPVGSDGDFSYDALIGRVNSDLANDIGNLTNRTLKMIQNYFDGRIPDKGEPEGGDEELIRFSRETVQLYRDNFDKLQINKALDNIWELISVANKYIVATAPTIMSRTQSRRERLSSVLYNAAETVRIIATLLAPIVPQGSCAILKLLELPGDVSKLRLNALNWGGRHP